ncbi:hypothetical protein [Arthrobacter polaris]|uniref:hypothetical protein n=1 Tax=Arthrobacter polaris TaxID=2813727 RepID=UPI001F414F59|nr:hypothetical protein [Arthrobacter polaris]UIK89431.1 hypothetical protein J0916_02955 [Arthrobacter polaris]
MVSEEEMAAYVGFAIAAEAADAEWNAQLAPVALPDVSVERGLDPANGAETGRKSTMMANRSQPKKP